MTEPNGGSTRPDGTPSGLNGSRPEPTGDHAEEPAVRTNHGRSKAARLNLIGEVVNQRGFVSVDDLTEQLGVSRMTVHRDLDELQRMSTLRKVRGGASAHRSTQFESDLQFRAMSAVEEKRKMARVAADLVSEGDVVIVDDSTTSLEVVPHLVTRPPLTIITNFMPAMQQVSNHPDINLIGLGGEYAPRYQSFLGMMCERSLADLYADVLFASTSAVRGLDLYHQDQRIVTAKRAMMQSAQRRVLLVDHSKIDHGALHRLGGIDEFTHVIVDDKVDASVIKSFEEAGVTVLVAS
ncbi:DeoR/GlpR family DNA-binding transcription regulator [Glaciibacter sp. 2TAF33]|uniref:DeoR/GlpR family DNA-binding transcription regulator n=1 Tax=Glaciibacter sp. 2TAF33 TaxID=3233015 RepID=UPI003F939A80